MTITHGLVHPGGHGYGRNWTVPSTLAVTANITARPLTVMTRVDDPVYVRAFDDPITTHHRPQHVYESRVPCPIYSDPDRRVVCQLTTNVNESLIWCEECGERGDWTPLHKSFQAMGTSFATVWQDTDTPNLTTGRVETDARKFAAYLRDRAEQDSERLGMVVDYQPVDPTDRDALGVTDDGLDATHDHRVATGQKDSRGRFVY